MAYAPLFRNFIFFRNPFSIQAKWKVPNMEKSNSSGALLLARRYNDVYGCFPDKNRTNWNERQAKRQTDKGTCAGGEIPYQTFF